MSDLTPATAETQTDHSGRPSALASEGFALPPARYPGSDVGTAAVAFLAFWLFTSNGTAALAYAATLGLLVYLARQAVLMHTMWEQLQAFSRGDTTWPWLALQRGLPAERTRRRRDPLEIRERVHRIRRELAGKVAIRWWCCAMAAFTIPLLGILSGWMNIEQYGDLMPRNRVFRPLTWAWLGGGIVVLLDCLLFFLSEQLWLKWEQIMESHAVAYSTDVPAIVEKSGTRPSGAYADTEPDRPGAREARPRQLTEKTDGTENTFPSDSPQDPLPEAPKPDNAEPDTAPQSIAEVMKQLGDRQP